VIVSKADGLSLSLSCRSCDWTVATTNYNHPVFDEAAYSVLASAPSLERQQFIAVLAVELGPQNERRTVDCERE
jgi:hypothetical protein